MKNWLVKSLTPWWSRLIIGLIAAILLVELNFEIRLLVVILALIISITALKLLKLWLEDQHENFNLTLQKTVGIIFIIPVVISVFLFLKQLDSDEDTLYNFSYSEGWTGKANQGTSGFQSPLPIYFGLMAVAAAILLKRK